MGHSSTSLASARTTDTLATRAERPVDLTRSDVLQAEQRIEEYVCETGPFRLLYATQQVDDEILDLLQQLADECELVEQFKKMRRGAVLNRIFGYESEERQVLHTACRDIFSELPKEPLAASQAKLEMNKLKEFLQQLEHGEIVNQAGEKFTTMINVGIGGSDLGPRSIYEALKPFRQQPREVRFIANVDPDDAAEVLQEIDLSRTLVNIVSKSGTTLETLTNEQLVVDRLKSEGLDPARHCIAVTGAGSPMDDPQKYLRSFYMFDYIGGRYSSTSMVGGVMLGFALGYDQLCEFLRGAAAIDEATEERELRKNIPLLLAMLGIWNHNFLGYSTLAVLPYSQALHRFPAHLQQCDMESNGKSINRSGTVLEHKTGPVVWGEPGTNGQHAFYQLLHQGTEVVPVEFIGFSGSQYEQDIQVEGSSSQEKLFANLLAQSLALATGKNDLNPNRTFGGNRPSSILLANRLTPEVMGALLAIYEAKIVLQGFCWDINSFDQEGVQLGKQLATTLLRKMSEQNSGLNPDDRELETRFLNVAKAGFSS